MKRVIALLAFCLLLASCGTTSLYYWGGEYSGATAYEHLAYKSYDKQTPESLCQLVAVYEDMIAHPGGLRNVPPPGICAEYGYFLLQPHTAEAFASCANSSQKSLFNGSDYVMLFHQRGEEMLKKEIELYPEAGVFIAPLIKKFTEQK